MERRRKPIEYDIAVGARVIVDTLEAPGTFAWATVQSVIRAIKFKVKNLPEGYPHKTEPGMDLFLSTTAFTLAGYNYHPYAKEGHYDPGTFFFATKKREGEVMRVPAEKKHKSESHQKTWKQPTFKM